MLRFFRLIRQKLLNENKLFKYLIYAIGEIALVIIGILIAVSLNNANEDRKQEEKIRSTLKQVQDEILITINNAATQIRFAAKIDSLYRVVFTKDLTAEDYRNDRNLYFLTRNGYTFTVENTSYQNLIQLSDNMPEGYDYLLKRLKKAYQGHWPMVEGGHIRLREKADQYTTEDVKEHEWASALFNNQLNDEAIDYMLNDFRFKNRVSEYNNKQNGSLNRSTIALRRALIDCYREIDRLLGTTPDSTKFFINNIEPYKDWIGTYELAPISYEIYRGDSSLVLKVQSFETEIYPLSAHSFHADYGTPRIITKGDSTERGIYLPNGLNELFLKKVQ